jgi:hypothetical protein
MVDGGQGKTDALDRDVFKTGFFGIPNGNNAITVVTREISGNTNVQRFTGLNPASARGAGLGDLNHDWLHRRRRRRRHELRLRAFPLRAQQRV